MILPCPPRACSGRGTDPRSGAVEGPLPRCARTRPSTTSCVGGPPPPDKLAEEFFAHATRLSGQAGLLFGWRPDDFWNATPAELAALADAASGDGSGVPATPIDLPALMERFPDE